MATLSSSWSSVTISFDQRTRDVTSTHHQHHHHQLNSPGWALAFLTSFLHLSLFLACLHQFLSFILSPSWSPPSRHVVFGLPIPCFPFWLGKKIFLSKTSFFVRVTCPAHCNLLIPMYFLDLFQYIDYIFQRCIFFIGYSLVFSQRCT